jgi:hypothetical protein
VGSPKSKIDKAEFAEEQVKSKTYGEFEITE